MLEQRIRNALVNNSPTSMALRDLFAVGCYFHAEGHETAGMKLCATALRAAEGAAVVGELIGNMAGHEAELAKASSPHIELECFISAIARQKAP
jgi:hypothetical protein